MVLIIQVSLAEGRHTNPRKKDQQSKITSSTCGGGASRQSRHLTMSPKPLPSYPMAETDKSYPLPSHTTPFTSFSLSSLAYWHRNLLLFSLCFSLRLRDQQWPWRHASEAGPCTRPRLASGNGLAVEATRHPGQGPPPPPLSRRPHTSPLWWRHGGRLASSASARTSSTKVNRCPYPSL